MITLRPPYLTRLFDAISQLLNVLLLNGDANESISGRAYRNEWVIQKWINKVIFWEPDHCYWAYMTDLERARELIKQPESSLDLTHEHIPRYITIR